MFDPAAKVLDQIDPVIDKDALGENGRRASLEIVEKDNDVRQVDEGRDVQACLCEESV